MSGPVAVHHVEDGPADAPAVVLAHAIGTSLEMWEPQVASLARHFRVVRYDARGHGSTAVPDGPYELGDLGGDLLALLDELGIARAHVVGLSLGAMVGLWVAAHAPNRVDRLVACSVTARPSRPEAWRDRAATVRAGGTRAVVDLVVERWGYVDRAPAIREQVARMLLATPAEGYAGSCEAIATMNLEPDLPSVGAPTLLVSGESDPAAPPAANTAMTATMPDARVSVVDAAHLLNAEQPDAVTRLILDHLLDTGISRRSP
jgi:3-oxoadipate enol-lactonase